MDIRKTRTCQKCKATVPLEKVRLFPKDKDSNLLLCEACCEEMKKNIVQKKPTLGTKAKVLPKGNYVPYFCDRCKYKFRVDEARVGLIYNLCCPYCGKDDRLSRIT